MRVPCRKSPLNGTRTDNQRTGERHLRIAVAEFVKHYHRERNHQGIGNELIDRDLDGSQGEVKCRERLGGLLKYYYRAAA